MVLASGRRSRDDHEPKMTQSVGDTGVAHR